MHPPRSDTDWLDAAARLALRARPLSRPNPAVGAILVKDGRVVGRGWTQPGGRPHAEAMALAMAGPGARGTTAFVTLEPCAHRSGRGPACADALAEAGVARVVAGSCDPDPRTAGAGISGLEKAGIAAQVMNHPASIASLAGYLTRTRLGRPHVTLKLATSLDGAIALGDGSSRWITGEVARAHVHSRRSIADAILVGGETWRQDSPRLDVRLPGLQARSPECWVLTSGHCAGARTIAAPEQIADMAGVQYIYVEGGASTAAAFLAADLVDRIELYTAPILIGGGRTAIGDIGLSDLAAAQGRWVLTEQRRLGSDGFAAYQRVRCSPA
ncbi:bifunctional diaminohydroxyphosphoribosylaminopyrimidine deaminase/5-amino-6-(5-phosphoribosylamino)uracil reductase RibD [Qipengyuania sediminis]|uniref:bifunctional diaminohydroxyphosphoribosylaminopyrimidine deaminase/5-amino-6-(5-phosphoribosylamino)uracil reductase RibD n=1 Tax=Qipengyuania sediminis TaxID=1532023 RepID=UPI001F0E1FF9|nr:bifunctional diaminohydroxyphosphoribosylaminopyrimidine deaminase/5-amino-6-(5-phosphoribosylamino)uracil reductase RibD [Qipengyuania sediminis]